ncbi:MAG TPA: YggS family pyridoxal phosphate-dependent enzyme [Geobacteraceae bacterium]|nr:YggS family pyridoxal phosphate-dependent enzyme [Geobacteraceae bacterium]
MSISSSLEKIRSQIDAAAVSAGRDPSDVRLIAVSKTKPASMVDEAAEAGQSVFGENYVQEFVAKAAEVKSAVEWHFIGHLQSNKVKQIAGIVAMIHSVDRFSLAQEIDRQWGRLGLVCDILIQVNVSCEATKSGTTSEEAKELVRQVSFLQNVRICGLMTMPPFFDDPEAARPYFRELRTLAREIESLDIPGVSMKELSMGMSGDFEVAVAEGATLVRIGSAIFGSR